MEKIDFFFSDHMQEKEVTAFSSKGREEKKPLLFRDRMVKPCLLSLTFWNINVSLQELLLLWRSQVSGLSSLSLEI